MGIEYFIVLTKHVQIFGLASLFSSFFIVCEDHVEVLMAKYEFSFFMLPVEIGVCIG